MWPPPPPSPVAWGDWICEARVRAVFDNPAESVEALATWRDAGVQKVSVVDGGTTTSCAACNEVNGATWNIAYAIDNPEQHPNCHRRFMPASGADMIKLAAAASQAVALECGIGDGWQFPWPNPGSGGMRR